MLSVEVDPEEMQSFKDDQENIDFFKSYISDVHLMIDAQVRNSIISFCHVMIYNIRSKQASSIHSSPKKILDEINQFCFSLTTVNSTKEFNEKLINFINKDEEKSHGSRENKGDGTTDQGIDPERATVVSERK